MSETILARLLALAGMAGLMAPALWCLLMQEKVAPALPAQAKWIRGVSSLVACYGVFLVLAAQSGPLATALAVCTLALTVFVLPRGRGFEAAALGSGTAALVLLAALGLGGAGGGGPESLGSLAAGFTAPGAVITLLRFTTKLAHVLLTGAFLALMLMLAAYCRQPAAIDPIRVRRYLRRVRYVVLALAATGGVRLLELMLDLGHDGQAAHFAKPFLLVLGIKVVLVLQILFSASQTIDVDWPAVRDLRGLRRAVARELMLLIGLLVVSALLAQTPYALHV